MPSRHSFIQFPAIHIPAHRPRWPLWPFELNRDSPQADSLVAWYPFSPDVSGFVHDIGPRGIYTISDGTHPPFVRDHELGLVPDLENGSTHYFLRTASPVVITAYPYTMTCWIRAESTGTSGVGTPMCLGGTGFNFARMQIVSTDQMQTQIQNVSSPSVATGAGALVLGKVQFCASAADASNLYVQVDDISASGSNTVALPTIGSFGIGARITSTTTANHYFDGMIKDVRVYNRVLSLEERNFIRDNPSDLYRAVGRVTYFVPPTVTSQSVTATIASSTTRGLQPSTSPQPVSVSSSIASSTTRGLQPSTSPQPVSVSSSIASSTTRGLQPSTSPQPVSVSSSIASSTTRGLQPTVSLGAVSVGVLIANVTTRALQPSAMLAGLTVSVNMASATTRALQPTINVGAVSIAVPIASVTTRGLQPAGATAAGALISQARSVHRFVHSRVFSRVN